MLQDIIIYNLKLSQIHPFILDKAAAAAPTNPAGRLGKRISHSQSHSAAANTLIQPHSQSTPMYSKQLATANISYSYRK